MLQLLTPWHWLGFGVLLILVELTIANGLCLGLAVAAGLVASCLWCFDAISWPYQFGLFGSLSLVTIMLWFIYLRPYLQKPAKRLQQNGEHHVGKVFMLTEPLIKGRGRLRIGEQIWLIAGPDLPTGSAVRILRCDGLWLKVAPGCVTSV